MSIALSAGASADPINESQRLARPSAKQIAFADWEVGAFFHYGLNPFTGQEHGDGQEPPSKFNPTELNIEQWILTAKAMGARYAVLTARHEGGFCLWPSKTTDYTIANSPYQHGQGDLVREFTEECRKHGLKVGLYHTAGFNAHEALKDYQGEINSPLDWTTTWGATIGKAFRADPTLRKRFNKIQVEQFRELLTNYGQIDFMWSDHWNAQDPDGVWRAVTDLAEELQPNMVMMGPDTWVPGNETGHVVYPMWNAVKTIDGTKYTRPAAAQTDVSVKNNYGLLETDVLAGHPFGTHWRVRECTTHSAFHYGGWFWHPDDVKKTYPRKTWEHVDLYYRTVGLGANTIINLPPDTRGLIPNDIEAAAKALGDEIRNRFSSPIAELEAPPQSEIVELRWEKPTKINTIVTMENIANGQKIVKYSLEAYVDDQWHPLEPRNKVVAWPPYNGNPSYQTIGHKKIDRVKTIVTNRLRFRCLESVADPVELRSFQVFHCPPIKREYSAAYPYLSGVDTIAETAHNGVFRDTNYRGREISIREKKFDRGLMICPVKSTKQAFADFDLTEFPNAKGLTAIIGIDDLTAGKGSAEFKVQGFVGGEWQPLYESPRLTGRSAGLPIKVDFLPGLEKIRLLTTDGGDGVNSDHAVWADVQFVE
ncbi:MAG: alpha-L-fucosidase [Lacipirellulaceae bacterium]